MKRTLLITLSVLLFCPAMDEVKPEPISDNPLTAFGQLFNEGLRIYKEQPNEALPIQQEALHYAYLTEMPEKIAKAQFHVGKTAYLLDDYSLAFEMFSLAKERYEELGNEVFVGWCYFNLAVIYNEARDYEEAKHLHNSAFEILQGKVTNADQAKLQRGEANIALESGDYEQAITQLHRALALAPNDSDNLSMANIRLAYCYRMLGQHEEARHHYYQSYQASKTDDSYEIYATSANQLAYYALQANQPNDALAYASAALGVLKDKWYSFDLENMLVNKLASSYFRIGQPQKAYEVITELLGKEECKNASDEITYTYELLIYKYLEHYGTSEEIAQAEAEQYAHRERIKEAKEDKSVQASAGVESAVLKMNADAKWEQAIKVLIWCCIVGGVVVLAAFISGFVNKRKAKRTLANQAAEMYAEVEQIQAVSEAKLTEREKAIEAILAQGRQELETKIADIEDEVKTTIAQNQEQDKAIIAQLEAELAEQQQKLSTTQGQLKLAKSALYEYGKDLAEYGKRFGK